MDRPPEQCTLRHFIISPAEIHFLRFLLEGYDGIAMLTTMDPRLGLVRLGIAPGCEIDVERILLAEGERMELRPVSLIEPPRLNHEAGL